MSSSKEKFTLGVEEEYQIVDPHTRELCQKASQLLPIAQDYCQRAVVQQEFRQSQIEVATPVCSSLEEVRSHMTSLRRNLIVAAEEVGCRLVAAGTHPFSPWGEQALTAKPCYQKLAHRYQGLMYELVTFGCHVHVGLSDPDVAIQVMNRVRGWLPALLALSASSPYWSGKDSQYASYRSVLIQRLPMAGIPKIFASYREYKSTIEDLLAMQMIDDSSQVCWDLRPSERFPTLEFRILDMPLTVDESVMLAGLVRGLVRTCYDQVCDQVFYGRIRPEVLAAAQWKASRWGLEADLADVDTAEAVPAQQLIAKLLAFVRPALEAFGEWEEVASLVQNVLRQGNGATRQRRVFAGRESLQDVVDYLIEETGRGCLAFPRVKPAALAQSYNKLR